MKVVTNMGKTGFKFNFAAYTFREVFIYILLLVAILYGSTVFNKYNLDDELVTRNHKLTSKGLNGIVDIFSSPYYQDEMGYSYEYRPIVLTSFAIEHAVLGESPAISHLINIILFALTCILIYNVSGKIFKNSSALFPFIVTTLFIIHPIHTEVVASIKNRDELLSLLFGLMAFRFSIFYHETNRKTDLLFMSVFMLASLLSKLSGLSFVIIIATWLILSEISFFRFLPVVFLLLFVTGAVLYQFNFNLIHIIKETSFLFVFLCAFYYLSQFKFSILESYSSFKKQFFDYLTGIHGNVKIVDYVILTFVSSGFFISFILSNPLLAIPFLIFSLLMIFYRNDNWQLIYLLFTAIFIAFSESLFPSLHLRFLFFILYYKFIFNKIIPAFLFYPFILLPILLLGLNNHIQEHSVFENDVTIISLFVMLEIVVKKFNLKSIFKILVWTIFSVLVILNTVIVNNKLNTSLFIIPILSVLYEIIEAKRLNILILLMLILFFILGAFQIKSPFGKLYISGKNGSSIESPIVNRPNKVSENVDSMNVAIANIVEFNQKRPLSKIEFPLGFDAGLSERIGTSFLILGKYFRMMFVPYPFGYYYGYDEIKIVPFYNPLSIFYILLHLGLIILAIIYLNRHVVLSFGIFFYLSSIFLFSNLMSPIAGMFGERLSYVASFGFCLIIGYLVYIMHAHTSIKNKKYVNISLMFVLLLFSGMTIVRNAQWKNHLTLMRHDIKNLENSAQAHNLLAYNLIRYSFENEYTKEADVMRREAIVHFKRAINIYPEFFNATFDLGRTYMMFNEIDSAYPYFIKVHKMDSTLADATLNIAMIAEAKNDFTTAVYYYERLMRINPYIKEAYANLSYLYFRANRPEKSIEINKKAIQYNPNWKEPYENIAQVYITMKDTVKANYYYNESLKRQ